VLADVSHQCRKRNTEAQCHTVPYRSSAQMSCGEEVDVSFVALEILEPQTARH
jgi:hypothetical protein